MAAVVVLSLKEKEVWLDVPISNEKSPIEILKYLTLGLDCTFLLPPKDFYLDFSPL